MFKIVIIDLFFQHRKIV